VSKDEIKYEINKVLDHLPDQALEELLTYLKSVENRQPTFPVDKKIIDRILTEDYVLLQKLAQ
jgi:hypothetical protein